MRTAFACLLVFCAFAHHSFSADLLMLGADSTTRLDFMKGRVLNGATIGGFQFGNVNSFDARTATPSLPELLQYSALVLWYGQSFSDPITLGHNLADYVDAGGNVVVMSFGTAFAPGGRWASGGYDPLIGGYGGPNAGSMTTIYDPSNPIFKGVNTINAEYIQPGTVRPGATLLASWNDMFQNGNPPPMVLQSNGPSGKVVNLNFFGAYPFPNTNGDIDRLIANTLNVLTVPEPSTWLMGLIAAGALGQSIRHRRKSIRQIRPSTHSPKSLIV